jgi:hypothetical protein
VFESPFFFVDLIPSLQVERERFEQVSVREEGAMLVRVHLQVWRADVGGIPDQLHCVFQFHEKRSDELGLVSVVIV